MNVRRAGLACLAACAAALAPPAHAHRCDRTDDDRAEASRVIRSLTREIDAMEAAVVEALRLQTGQLSGYQAQSAKALTQALDAQTRLQAQIAREVEETEAMRARRPSPGACTASPGLRGSAEAGARRPGRTRGRAPSRSGASSTTGRWWPRPGARPTARPASRP